MNTKPKFDPYHKWFGIPAQEQPPNHYRLLRINLFESDPEVIENAYDKEMADLKAQEHGPHAEFVDQLSREMIEARDCVLNGEKKAIYDTQLRTQLDAEEETKEKSEQQSLLRETENAVRVAIGDLTAELNQLRTLAKQMAARRRTVLLTVNQLRRQLKQLAAEDIPTHRTSVFAPLKVFDRWLEKLAGEGNVILHGALRVAAVLLILLIAVGGLWWILAGKSEELADTGPEWRQGENRPPSLETLSDMTVVDGEELTFTARMANANGFADRLRFSLHNGPAGATLDASRGKFRWTPTSDQAGRSHEITVRVVDDSTRKLLDEQRLTIAVDRSPPTSREVLNLTGQGTTDSDSSIPPPLKSPPKLAAVTNRTVTASEELTFTARTNSPTGPNGKLRFAMENGPTGAAIDSVTGVFRWTPTNDQAGSTHRITLRVHDPVSPTVGDEQSFDVTVNAATTTAEAARFYAPSQVVAHYDPKYENWYPLSLNAKVTYDEPLLVLPAYIGRFQVDSGMSLSVPGPTKLAFTREDASKIPAVHVEYGIASIASRTAGTRYGLSFGNRSGVITFGQAVTLVAFRVKRYLPPESDPETTRAHLILQLLVVRGNILWSEGKNEKNVNALSLLTVIDDREVVVESKTGLRPPWATELLLIQADKEAASTIEKSIDPRSTVESSLTTISRDADIEVRALANRYLTHFENYEPSVNDFSDRQLASHWERSFDTMQDSLARGPESARRVREAWQRMRGPDGRDLYRMLWGYSVDQMTAGEDKRLASHLAHDDLDYRVLAFLNLKNLTQLTYLYRPEVNAASRAAAAQRWQSEIANGRLTYSVPSSPTSLVSPSKPPPRPIDKAPTTKPFAAPEVLTIRTQDGVDLKCNYYPGPNSKHTVPVILVHGWSGNRDQFQELATSLQTRGHSVIIPDLRGHGASTRSATGVVFNRDRMGSADLGKMIQFDMDALKRFLVEKNNAGKLNIEMLCVVGAEEGSLLALNWVMFDWSRVDLIDRRQGKDAKAVVMLSPSQSFKGLPWTTAVRYSGAVYKIPTLIIAGDKDTAGTREARRMRTALRGFDLELAAPATNARGTMLLDPKLAPEVTKQIETFIDKYLVAKRADFPWTDRSSP